MLSPGCAQVKIYYLINLPQNASCPRSKVLVWTYRIYWLLFIQLMYWAKFDRFSFPFQRPVVPSPCWFQVEAIYSLWPYSCCSISVLSPTILIMLFSLWLVLLIQVQGANSSMTNDPHSPPNKLGWRPNYSSYPILIVGNSRPIFND